MTPIVSESKKAVLSCGGVRGVGRRGPMNLNVNVLNVILFIIN